MYIVVYLLLELVSSLAFEVFRFWFFYSVFHLTDCCFMVFVVVFWSFVCVRVFSSEGDVRYAY